jgi:uncharacterized repeat protein (TIGR01451 family)
VTSHPHARRLRTLITLALAAVGCLLAPAAASANPPGTSLPCTDTSWSHGCGGVGPDGKDLVSGQPYHHNFKDDDQQGNATLNVSFSSDGKTGTFTSNKGLSDYTIAFCDGSVTDVGSVGGDQKTYTFSYGKPIRSIRVKAGTTNRTFLSNACGTGGDDGGSGDTGGGGDDGDGGGGDHGGGGSTPDTTLKVVKRATKHELTPGSADVFKIVVRNTGDHTARNVELCDRPDSQWTFVSASRSTSTVSGSETCYALGDIASGSRAALRVTLRLNADAHGRTAVNWAVARADNAAEVKDKATVRIRCNPADITPDLVPVQKVEQPVELQAGQTRTVQLSCPTGFVMTDGTPRVDAVDQDTGTLASVRVLASRSVSPGTYEMVVENTATGRAQLHLFGTCLAAATADQHLPLQVGGPVETTQTWDAGRQTATLTCPDGGQPIAPGFSLAGGEARLVESEPAGPGAWTIGFDVSAPTTAVLSVRCLDDQLGGSEGALHRLDFTHEVTEVDVPAGQMQSAQVICGQQAKGIVGSFDVPPGLVLLGHDPQPKTRVFYPFNPTAGPLHVKLDLLCVGDRTIAAQACAPSAKHGGGHALAAVRGRKD